MTQQPGLPTLKDLTSSDVRVRIVDIGANPIDGTPPYANLLNAGIADLVGFDPNPDSVARLNQMKGPFETYLPYAIGDGNQHTLHVCAAQGMTSLLKPNPAVLARFHGFPLWSHVMSTQPIHTVRLDDIPETAGMDLLKLDIQGAELMVCQNALNRLRETLVIHTEVEFLPMYENQPLFSELEIFLRQQGFMFHRFFPTVSRMITPLMIDNDEFAGMSQLLWAEAIFVRDFTRFDELSDRLLLAMATIIHDCYRSLDLVLNILTQYDSRTGAQLSGRYLANLQAQGRPLAA